MEQKKAEELVRRLAAALRGTELYSPTHPLVQRGIDALGAAAIEALQAAPTIVVGFIGDEMVVDGTRLPRGTASLDRLRARPARARDREDHDRPAGSPATRSAHFIAVLSDRKSHDAAARPAARRAASATSRSAESWSKRSATIRPASPRRGASTRTAVETAETLWNAAKAGDQPDPGAARKIIDGLARLVTQDRTSLMALTALKKYDNYTFTHMVNVSALAMAQARALNIDGALLREFGFAALMHDIGKVNTPLEVLNKPDKLTQGGIRHHEAARRRRRAHPAADAGDAGAGADRRVRAPPEAGSQRLSGEHRQPQAEPVHDDRVSIADVFDALRSNRPYREGLATERIRAIMGEQGNPAFNQVLLKRFVNLMGLFPVGNLVRLEHRGARRRHRRAPDRSVPAAGEDHHRRQGRRARRAAARQHVGARQPRRASARGRRSGRSRSGRHRSAEVPLNGRT